MLFNSPNLTIINTEVAMNVDVNSDPANIIVSKSESEIDITDLVDHASSDHDSTNDQVTAEQNLERNATINQFTFIIFLVMIIALQYSTVPTGV